MKLRYILSVVMMCLVFLASAQKFGHLNSNELLLTIPDIKHADDQLAAYQKSLEGDYIVKVQAFEAEYKQLVERANSGEIAEMKLQQEQADLARKQETLKNLETEGQQKILAKREELYAPIFKKVEDAVKAIGKENQYTMIFDTSMGFILHGDDSEDVTAKVKAKLGI